jgi:hypothetical protein
VAAGGSSASLKISHRHALLSVSPSLSLAVVYGHKLANALDGGAAAPGVHTAAVTAAASTNSAASSISRFSTC